MLKLFIGKKKEKEPIHTKYEPFKADLLEHGAFSKFNPESETWRYLETWLKNKIQKKREKNDTLNLTEVQTAVLRGEIKAYKYLLKQKFLKEKGILNEQDVVGQHLPQA